jgi:uncharacterized protein (TIGR03792 family)
MTIEWLRYRVPSEVVQSFLKADAEIWTTMLSQQVGFISKQTWLNPAKPHEINLVIYWKSKEHWKAIAHIVLQETDRRFVETVGQFELLEVLEYEVL